MLLTPPTRFKFRNGPEIDCTIHKFVKEFDRYFRRMPKTGGTDLQPANRLIRRFAPSGTSFLHYEHGTETPNANLLYHNTPLKYASPTCLYKKLAGLSGESLRLTDGFAR